MVGVVRATMLRGRAVVLKVCMRRLVVACSVRCSPLAIHPTHPHLTCTSMNGTDRATLMHQRDAFLARILVAIGCLGESMTVVTTPHKGKPITQLVTSDADQVKVDFALYEPSTVNGHWRLHIAGIGYDKQWRRLDLVDVETVAAAIAKPIAAHRAECAAQLAVRRLNARLPVGCAMRASTNRRGGLTVDVRDPLTEGQAQAILDVASSWRAVAP